MSYVPLTGMHLRMPPKMLALCLPRDQNTNEFAPTMPRRTFGVSLGCYAFRLEFLYEIFIIMDSCAFDEVLLGDT